MSELPAHEVKSTGRFWEANIAYVTSPQEIVPGVNIIPTRSEKFGNFISSGPEQSRKFIGLPELSATFATAKGDVLVVGCSHSGIEVIVQATEQARKQNIYMVVGGFHLLENDRQYVQGITHRLKDEFHVTSVAPAHCTGHLAFSILKEAYGPEYRFFGLGSRIEI